MIQEKDKKYVFWVTPDNKVGKKEIVTGRRSPGKVEVISGLTEGTQVIIQGITRVRPGTTVIIVETSDAGRLAG